MNIGSIQPLSSNGSIGLKALILLDSLISAITGGWFVITGLGFVSATSEKATDGCVLLRKYAPRLNISNLPDNDYYKVNTVAFATFEDDTYKHTIFVG